MKPMTMKVTMLAAIVMLQSPTVVMAQEGTAEGQAQGQGQAKAAPDTPNKTAQARIDAAISTAAEAKIPVSLLQSKVDEGQAKHVPLERIAAAVEMRLKGLVRASEALQRADVGVQNEGELLVSSDALEAGVSENALVRISREAPAERRAVAIAVLTDLVRLGAASDNALARVTGAASSSAALANLHAEVAGQLHRGGLKSTLEAAGIIRTP